VSYPAFTSSFPLGVPAVSNDNPVLDYFGRAIKAGDTVVYPVRQGSSMWMARMLVTQVIGGTTPRLSGTNPEGRRVSVHKIKNVIVVQLPTPPSV